MYCRYCGNDIGASGRFCQFCGKPREEEIQDLLSKEDPVPETSAEELKPESPPEVISPEVPTEAKTKKQSRGLLKWILLAVWLLAVAGGWVAALVLLEQPSPQEMPEPVAYRQWEPVALTESDWYQYDLASKRLYCWSFREDGTVLYGYADSRERSTTSYTLQEDRLIVADVMVWTYDELENCYWYTQEVNQKIHQVRIFPAKGIPDLLGSCYDYISE